MKIRVVNLSSYTTPKVKEVKNQDFVSYGDDNNYYQYLIDRYNGSPTNNAAINGISQLIFGKGLDATNSNKKPDQYAQMKSLFTDDCVMKLVNDLKLLGQCAMQVVYNELHTEILMVEHFPVETLRAERANEDGDILGYYYYHNWTEYRKGDELDRYPAFGTSKEGMEILFVKPYKTGFYYYSPVDYQGGLQYAELEEEISNYHLNNIMNGLAPSMLINFNNGVPDEEQRELIEQRIYEKFSGSSNAGKFILAFNDDSTQSASIEPVQLSDAHNQYQFLSDESMRKIMVAHRIVSPMLLGIKDNTGFGNNAEELKTASQLMDNTVIRPFQNLLIKSFDQILAYNDIALDLYFKTLQPIEFTDLDNAMNKEQVEQETGQKLSAHNLSEFSDELLERAYQELQNIEDEDMSDYELVDERPADVERDRRLNNIFKFATVAQSTPSETSEQDNELFKVRYQYAPLNLTFRKGIPVSREFCVKMVNAAKVYRIEDIDRDLSVNPGFGEGGSSSYNIFMYKGGAQCKHFFMRKVYIRKNNKKITVNEARQMINALEPEDRAGARLDVNPPEVAMRPFDMEDRGYVNPPQWLR
jgi:hypothetical protein